MITMSPSKKLFHVGDEPIAVDRPVDHQGCKIARNNGSDALSMMEKRAIPSDLTEKRAVDRVPGVNSRAWYPKAMRLLPSGIAFPTTRRITGGSRIISTTCAPHVAAITVTIIECESERNNDPPEGDFASNPNSDPS